MTHGAGGAPATVVLVPGLGLDGRAWRRVQRLLPPPAMVVALPAMGATVPETADPSVAGQATLLAQCLPRGRRTVLVGHSASCQVVVETAARQTSVCGVVLVGPTTDPAARGWVRTLWRWIRTARHERLWEAGVLAPQYRRTGLASMVRAMNRVRRHRLDAAVPGLAARVVVVRGSRDRIAPARWCMRLARASSGSVTTVPGGAHMVPLTHPRAVADVVEEARRGCAAGNRATGQAWPPVDSGCRGATNG